MLLYRGLGQGQSQSANSHFYWNDDEMLNCWVVEGGGCLCRAVRGIFMGPFRVT